MRSAVGLGTLFAVLVVLSQPVGTQAPDGLMSDLTRDVKQVHSKMMQLAKAMPEKAYAWRPGMGVRSTEETFMHVAADNYFIPTAMGFSAPPETGITEKFETSVAFEKKTRTREEALAELEKSFAFLEKLMGSFPEDKLDAPLDVFGQKMTNRRLWIMTTTHLHEHLGQLIAYARSNNVRPPWSK
jgi:uncharacterized damage-inducible protein DinB